MLLGVDVGGTFTDAVLLEEGRLHTAKAPTTPDDQSRGVLEAITAVLDEAGRSREDVERFVHGMTVGTNALLESKVAKTALFATAGFTDLEELGRQARADLYRLCAGHPPPLVPPASRVAVHERTGPDGVQRPLDEEALTESIQGLLRRERPDAAAVCLLWGFRHPAHEQRVAELLSNHDSELHVSTSHETAGVFREYERCATTVVDAALSPVLSRYLERLADRATDERLPVPEIMLSGGGVADAATAARHGSWTVLSGPAGGAVGAARMAERAGAPDAVALDMGGTSCDVSVVQSGAVRRSGGREVGGRALTLPMVDVHTVGAGGGSVAWTDAGGALRVGPRSAGADPGPACYGRGGEEPTVTDAHLMLGHLDTDAPLAGGVALDRGAAESAIERVAETAGLSVADAAAGIVRVASVEMARAVRVMTVERGVDPRPLALVAFGGAGPLHAAAIADELRMDRIVVPRSSGVLSALGLVVSERRRDLAESVLLSGRDLTAAEIATVADRLAERGRSDLRAPEAEARYAYDLRYAGQGFELMVGGSARPEPDDLRRDFDAAHRDRYGYDDPRARLELVTIRVTVAEPGPQLGQLSEGEADVRGELARERPGPALVRLPEATLLVPPAWTAREDERDRTIVMERD